MSVDPRIGMVVSVPRPSFFAARKRFGRLVPMASLANGRAASMFLESPVQRRRWIAGFWLAVTFMPIALLSGCSKPEDDRQASQPTYEVADDESAADDPSATAAGPGSPATGMGTSGGTPPVQPPPLSSDKLNASEAIKIPEGTPQQLIEFIISIQQQVEELARTQPAPGTESAVRDRVRALSETEIKAVDKLLASNPDPAIRKKAIDSKMHAMGYLTQVDPKPSRMEDLRAFVQQLATDSDPELSIQGRAILLGLRAGELRQGPNPDTKGLLNELKILLADEHRERSVQDAALQAYETLQMLGLQEAADEAFAMTAAAFKDHADPALANEAANMLKELELRQFGLDAKTDAVARREEGAVEPFMAAMRQVLSQPNPKMVVLNKTLRAIMMLDQTGQYSLGLDLCELVRTTYSKSSDEQLRNSALQAADTATRYLEFGIKRDAVARREPGSVEPFMAAVKEALVLPDPQIIDRVLQAVMLLEQTGQYPLGIELCQLIQEAVAKNADERLASAIKQATDVALRRLQLVGKPLELKGTTVDGSAFDFSPYQGKVILVDFWATWCGPCIQELPNLRKNYELYRDKGFDIIGVNLDQDRDALMRFLQTEKLPWTSIIGLELAQTFGVETIPFILLVDRNGIVVDLHIRGEQLGPKVAELLGAAAPAASPAKSTPGPGAKKQSRAVFPQRVPGLSTRSLAAVQQGSSGGPVGLVYATDPPAAEQSDSTFGIDSEEAEDLELPEIDEHANPYLAGADLTPMELVNFLMDMQEKPRSIRKRPGFTLAIVDAADRILAADTKDRYQTMAALTKFSALHEKAQLGDDAADEMLWKFVLKMKDDKRPEVAEQVNLFQLERRTMQADELDLKKIPSLLTDLESYFSKQATLGVEHLRLASLTVHAINRLDDDAQREKHFAEFGKLFSNSNDGKLARYGKKLMGDKKSPSELIGKPLELEGETAMGALLDWASYRGKVVIVDFWATWCTPCRREMTELKAMREELAGKAFDVVGVNLDRDEELLADYFKNEKVSWTNLVGPSTQQIAKRYGVRGIPTLVLVDAKGVVIAVSHSVAELKPALAELSM